MPEEPAQPDADAYTVALEEGRRAIDQQRDDLKSLRDRATALLTVGGVAAAFLGGLALRDTEAAIGYWTFAGAGMFAAIAVVVVKILLPKKVTFPQDPHQILSWIERGGYSTGQVRQFAAYYHGLNYSANSKVLETMLRDYQIGIGFLVAELVTLIIALRGR